MTYTTDKVSFISGSNNRVSSNLNSQSSTNEGLIASLKNFKLFDCGLKVVVGGLKKAYKTLSWKV